MSYERVLSALRSGKSDLEKEDLLVLISPDESTKENVKRDLDILLPRLLSISVATDDCELRYRIIKCFDTLKEAFLRKENIAASEWWKQVEIYLTSDFMIKLKVLIDSDDPIWKDCWSFVLFLCFNNPSKKGKCLNSVLKTAEHAFKSNQKATDTAFLCWLELIEEFVKNHTIMELKRTISLLIKPLTSTQLNPTDKLIKLKAWKNILDHFWLLARATDISSPPKESEMSCVDNILTPLINYMFLKKNFSLAMFHPNECFNVFMEILTKDIPINDLVPQVALAMPSLLDFTIDNDSLLQFLNQILDMTPSMNVKSKEAFIPNMTKFVTKILEKKIVLTEEIIEKMSFLDSSLIEKLSENIVTKLPVQKQDEKTEISNNSESGVSSLNVESVSPKTTWSSTLASKSVFMHRLAKAESEKKAKSNCTSIHDLMSHCSPKAKVENSVSQVSPIQTHSKINVDDQPEQNSLASGTPKLVTPSKIQKISSSPQVTPKTPVEKTLPVKSPQVTPKTPKSPKVQAGLTNLTPKSKTPTRCAYFENDNASDYVVVKPKEKVTVLTEHQKEILSKRKSDIPALYQDLSQDTQSVAKDFDEIVTHSISEEDQRWLLNEMEAPVSNKTGENTANEEKIDTSNDDVKRSKETELVISPEKMDTPSEKEVKMESTSTKGDEISSIKDDSESEKKSDSASSGKKPSRHSARSSMPHESSKKRVSKKSLGNDSKIDENIDSQGSSQKERNDVQTPNISSDHMGLSSTKSGSCEGNSIKDDSEPEKKSSRRKTRNSMPNESSKKPVSKKSLGNDSKINETVNGEGSSQNLEEKFQTPSTSDNESSEASEVSKVANSGDKNEFDAEKSDSVSSEKKKLRRSKIAQQETPKRKSSMKSLGNDSKIDETIDSEDSSQILEKNKVQEPSPEENEENSPSGKEDKSSKKESDFSKVDDSDDKMGVGSAKKPSGEKKQLRRSTRSSVPKQETPKFKKVSKKSTGNDSQINETIDSEDSSQILEENEVQEPSPEENEENSPSGKEDKSSKKESAFSKVDDSDDKMGVGSAKKPSGEKKQLRRSTRSSVSKQQTPQLKKVSKKSTGNDTKINENDSEESSQSSEHISEIKKQSQADGEPTKKRGRGRPKSIISEVSPSSEKSGESESPKSLSKILHSQDDDQKIEDKTRHSLPNKLTPNKSPPELKAVSEPRKRTKKQPDSIKKTKTISNLSIKVSEVKNYDPNTTAQDEINDSNLDSVNPSMDVDTLYAIDDSLATQETDDKLDLTESDFERSVLKETSPESAEAVKMAESKKRKRNETDSPIENESKRPCLTSTPKPKKKIREDITKFFPRIDVPKSFAFGSSLVKEEKNDEKHEELVENKENTQPNSHESSLALSDVSIKQEPEEKITSVKSEPSPEENELPVTPVPSSSTSTPLLRTKRRSIAPLKFGESWPCGAQESWIASVPSPGITPTKSNLKTLNSQIQNGTPSNSMKKRVSFVEPVVTKGLLYDHFSNIGEVHVQDVPSASMETDVSPVLDASSLSPVIESSDSDTEMSNDPVAPVPDRPSNGAPLIVCDASVQTDDVPISQFFTREQIIQLMNENLKFCNIQVTLKD